MQKPGGLFSKVISNTTIDGLEIELNKALESIHVADGILLDTQFQISRGNFSTFCVIIIWQQ